MPSAYSLDFVQSGVKEFDQALSELGNKTMIRKVVSRPAQRALQPVRADLKQRSRRTHPLSMQRDPTSQSLVRAGRSPNRRIGPMARYVAISRISARSAFVGAKLFYDTKKFPNFVVTGRRTKKRAFYPASQEYGAKGAKPPIKKKGQMAGAAAAAGSRALVIFRREFTIDYERHAGIILRKKRR